MSPAAASRCPGCGLLLPLHDGPVHPYIGVSAVCWAQYGQLLACQYGPLGMPAGHRLTVDAYAVQHPGVPERRSVQSVALHLIALHLVLDRGEGPQHVTGLLGRLLPRLPELRWLPSPRPNSTLTVRDVVTAGPRARRHRLGPRRVGRVDAAPPGRHRLAQGGQRRTTSR